MDIIFSEVHNKSNIAFVDEVGEYKVSTVGHNDGITVEENSTKPPEPILVDNSNWKPEIKPFDPNYEHKYDPEGDKPDPSTKSVSKLIEEEEEEKYKEKKQLTSEEWEIQFKKDLVKKIRTIEAHKMGKHPLIGFCDLSQLERKKFVKNITEIFNKALIDEYLQNSISEEFNEIVRDIILAEGKDYSNYVVYNH